MLIERIAAGWRRLILDTLAAAGGYEASPDLLHMVLDGQLTRLSRDQLRTHLAWLAEQGLIRLESVGGLELARLTSRGQDVAADRAQVPGVARPLAE